MQNIVHKNKQFSSAVMSSSVNSFKNKLDKLLVREEVYFDWKASIDGYF